MKAAITTLSIALLAGACADDRTVYAGVKFDILTAPPVPVSVESDRIELTVGVAVQVSVTPLSSERKYARDDLVLLRADDPDTLGIYAGEEDIRDFVLVGIRPGNTCLQIKINRRQEECIDVRVRAAE